LIKASVVVIGNDETRVSMINNKFSIFVNRTSLVENESVDNTIFDK
jgi:hypothetical protein